MKRKEKIAGDLNDVNDNGHRINLGKNMLCRGQKHNVA